MNMRAKNNLGEKSQRKMDRICGTCGKLCLPSDKFYRDVDFKRDYYDQSRNEPKQDLGRRECTLGRSESSRTPKLFRPIITDVSERNKASKRANENIKSRYHVNCTTESSPKRTKRRYIKRNVIISDDHAVNTEVLRGNLKRLSNQCYCKDANPVKTKFDNKLKHRDRDYLDSEPSYNKNILFEVHNLPYKPESEFLRRMQEDAKQLFDCKCSDCWEERFRNNLKYTDRRELIEKSYEFGQKPTFHYSITGKPCQYITDTNCEKTKRTEPRTKYRHEFRDKDSYDSNGEFDTDFSDPSSSDIHDRISRTIKIRKENYFETHSTNDLIKNIPSHRCVHQFDLDERLLPVPLNADSYGTSRCYICYKPMQYNKKLNKQSKNQPSFTDSLSRDKFLGDNSRTSYCFETTPRTDKRMPQAYQKLPQYANYVPINYKTTNQLSYSSETSSSGPGTVSSKTQFSKKTENNLTNHSSHSKKGKRRVNFGNNSEIIDFRLDSNRHFRDYKPVVKPNSIPTNSLALRFQKGVLKYN